MFCFLVYYLSLLVGTSTVEQYEIFYDGEGKCSVELSDKKCDSLVELIEFYQSLYFFYRNRFVSTNVMVFYEFDHFSPLHLIKLDKDNDFRMTYLL